MELGRVIYDLSEKKGRIVCVSELQIDFLQAFLLNQSLLPPFSKSS